MRKMNDSGIEWIGKVPEGWSFARIGSLYGLRNEKVSDNDFQPLSVTKLGILPQLETAAKTDAHDDRKLVKKGDFAINSRSDRRGSCGISEYDGSVSLINIVLYPVTEMNPQYHNWLFHTREFADEFYRCGHGIVNDLWTTNWQAMKNIVIVQPPLPEQRAIADYLDEKCGEADALAAEIREQIDTLERYKRSLIAEKVTKGLDPNAPMKDSGIEWIGKVPEHWGIVRIKDIYELISGATPASDEENWDGDIPWVTPADYKTNDKYVTHGKRNLSRRGYNSCSTNLIPPGSIIFSKRAPIGTVAINLNELCTNQGCLSCIAKGNTNSYFYYYIMSIGTEHFELLGSGTTFKEISSSRFGDCKVPLPPLPEQRAIADYLDEKCGEADSVIEQKRRQLEVLEEYKKSLIYEYVTGKKEVPAL